MPNAVRKSPMYWLAKSIAKKCEKLQDPANAKQFSMLVNREVRWRRWGTQQRMKLHRLVLSILEKELV